MKILNESGLKGGRIFIDFIDLTPKSFDAFMNMQSFTVRDFF